MNFKEILELIDKVAQSGIASIEIDRAGMKVRIEGKAVAPVAAPLEHTSQPQSYSAALSAAPPPESSVAPAVAEVDPSWHIVTSPIVGTFYRSPSPESAPFANIGDQVSKGGVICIIEAMKLMNEIESDSDGVVMKIFPQNGQPVEYGEKLFAIRT